MLAPVVALDEDLAVVRRYDLHGCGAAGADTVRAVDARTIIRLIALGRTALGVVALTRPEIPGRPWVGSGAGSTAGHVLARALGGRDLALGLGALTSPEPARWALAAAGADALDAAITMSTFARLPRWGRWMVLGSAAGAAIAGGWAARSLSD